MGKIKITKRDDRLFLPYSFLSGWSFIYFAKIVFFQGTRLHLRVFYRYEYRLRRTTSNHALDLFPFLLLLKNSCPSKEIYKPCGCGCHQSSFHREKPLLAYHMPGRLVAFFRTINTANFSWALDSRICKLPGANFSPFLNKNVRPGHLDLSRPLLFP